MQFLVCAKTDYHTQYITKDNRQYLPNLHILQWLLIIFCTYLYLMFDLNCPMITKLPVQHRNSQVKLNLTFVV